ncbi:hypothetical protein ACHAQJ_000469 [Trichoderma viride]
MKSCSTAANGEDCRQPVASAFTSSQSLHLLAVNHNTVPGPNTMDEPDEIHLAREEDNYAQLSHTLDTYDWMSDPDRLLIAQPPLEPSPYHDVETEPQLSPKNNFQGMDCPTDMYTDQYSDTSTPTSQMDDLGFSNTLPLPGITLPIHYNLNLPI